MSINKQASQVLPFERNFEELREKGLTVISGVFKPMVGQLAVSETADLGLFDRSRSLTTAVGRVATLHGGRAALEHTALGMALHKVLGVSSALGLRLGPKDTSHHTPNIQALELSSRYTFNPGRLGQDALGLTVLEGQISVGFDGDEQQLLEPGSAVFIHRDLDSPHPVVAQPHGHATALLFAGSAVMPTHTPVAS